MDATPNAVELTVDNAWFIAETIGAGTFPWVLAITMPYSDAAQGVRSSTVSATS
ncbi:putative ESX-3 secretion-associated protein EspG3 [Mycobacterium tuberculosis]|nr:putative ESX-3 secretion-associated protein EspG3 [Mycobacterium tuberculosis]